MLVRSHEAPAHQNGYKPPLAAAVNPFYWAERASEGRFWVAMLVLPAILVIAVIVLYPTLYGIGLSVREMRLTRPDLGTGFVGLKH